MMWVSILSFVAALYFTANVLEFWANQAIAPRTLIGIMAIAWTAFAWTQGLFII